jgi:hypothetical protein
MHRTSAAAVGITIVLACAAGCTSYYKVTDPTTGREYYTQELRQGNQGAATLKDGRTGNTVNLQNSEIAVVTKEQYESGRLETPKESKPENPFK